MNYSTMYRIRQCTDSIYGSNRLKKYHFVLYHPNLTGDNFSGTTILCKDKLAGPGINWHPLWEGEL
jgi:hypothetical protein